MLLKARAYGKANLCLNIVGTRGDMHTLDMLNTSIDLYDELTFEFRDDHNVNLNIEADDIFDFSPKMFADNVMRLLPKINEVYHFTGVDVILKKNIPSGGGFGGSSACAAATAKLVEMKNEVESSNEMLVSLGSDIPFMYHGGFQRVQGIGEIVTPVDLSEMTLLLVKPRGGVSTKECYNLYDTVRYRKTADIEKTIDALKNMDLPLAQELQANQLTTAAETLLPEIAVVKRHLRDYGAEWVTMTGSGSGVVMIARSQEEAESFKQTLPKKWWSKIVKTRQIGVEIL